VAACAWRCWSIGEGGLGRPPLAAWRWVGGIALWGCGRGVVRSRCATGAARVWGGRRLRDAAHRPVVHRARDCLREPPTDCRRRRFHRHRRRCPPARLRTAPPVSVRARVERQPACTHLLWPYGCSRKRRCDHCSPLFPRTAPPPVCLDAASSLPRFCVSPWPTRRCRRQGMASVGGGDSTSTASASPGGGIGHVGGTGAVSPDGGTRPCSPVTPSSPLPDASTVMGGGRAPSRAPASAGSGAPILDPHHRPSGYHQPSQGGGRSSGGGYDSPPGVAPPAPLLPGPASVVRAAGGATATAPLPALPPLAVPHRPPAKAATSRALQLPGGRHSGGPAGLAAFSAGASVRATPGGGGSGSGSGPRPRRTGAHSASPGHGTILDAVLPPGSLVRISGNNRTKLYVETGPVLFVWPSARGRRTFFAFVCASGLCASGLFSPLCFFLACQ